MKKFIEWVKKAIDFLGAPWRWLVKIARTEAFLLAFPLGVFGLSAFFMESILFFMAMLLWLIPIVKGVTYENE